MPSEGRIFAFFCSERDHKPQNSGCGYTTQSFHTAWAMRSRIDNAVGAAGSTQTADQLAVGQRDGGELTPARLLMPQFLA
jgi:hypothetical protein